MLEKINRNKSFNDKEEGGGIDSYPFFILTKKIKEFHLNKCSYKKGIESVAYFCGEIVGKKVRIFI